MPFVSSDFPPLGWSSTFLLGPLAVSDLCQVNDACNASEMQTLYAQAQKEVIENNSIQLVQSLKLKFFNSFCAVAVANQKPKKNNHNPSMLAYNGWRWWRISLKVGWLFGLPFGLWLDIWFQQEFGLPWLSGLLFIIVHYCSTWLFHHYYLVLTFVVGRDVGQIRCDALAKSVGCAFPRWILWFQAILLWLWC